MCNSVIHYYKGNRVAGLLKRLRVAGGMGKGTRDFLIKFFGFYNGCKIELYAFREPNAFIRVDSEMLLIRVDSEMVYFDNGEGWRRGES